MIGILGVFGIVALFAAGVLYVEENAKARIEGERMAFALQVKSKSIADTQALIEKERAKTQKDIQVLKDAAARIPKTKPLSEFCRPGCKTRWPE